MKINKSSVNNPNVKSAGIYLMKHSCLLNVLSKTFDTPVVRSQTPFNIRALKNFKLILLCTLLSFGAILASTMKAQEFEPSQNAKQNDSSISERKKHKNIFSIESETAFSFNLENLFSNCSQTPISIKETKEGNLTIDDCIVNNRYANEYTFSGSAGQQIFISMHSSEGSQIDPYLYLLKDGKVIASNDDSSEESLNSQISGADGHFTLPFTGTYTIRVTTFDAVGSKFSYTGKYNLSLKSNNFDDLPASEAIILENVISEISIDNNSTSMGCSYSLSPSNTWYAQASGASPNTITINTQTGCGWSAVSNVSWITITAGGGNRTGTGTFIYTVAQNTGTFRTGTITINTAGLTLTNYQDSPTPACSQTSISYGQTMSGNITTSDCTIYGIYTDIYTFNGNTGDRISVTMNSPQFSVFPRLADSNRNIISNSPSDFTLTSPGTYLIFAGSDVRLPNTSGSTGSYNITLTNLSNQTYTVSGQVTENGSGVSGVTMTLNPNAPFSEANNVDMAASPNVTTVTDANGNYFFNGVFNGFYVVFPTQSGRTFTPPSQNVSVNGGNQFGINFQRNNLTPNITSLNPSEKPVNSPDFTLIIGGNNFASGATVLFGGQTKIPSSITSTAIQVNISTADIATVGQRSVQVINPAPGGGPSNIVQFNVTQIPTYLISGRITKNGASLAGVTVALSGSSSDSAISDSSGNYTFPAVPANGNYTVTPNFSGHTFSPPIYQYTNLSSHQFDQNFTAIVNCTYSISPTSATHLAMGGTFGFNLLTTTGCQWQASSSAPSWLTTTSSGTGNGTVIYKVEPNTLTTSRSATITAGGKIFTVSQNGAANQTYSISGRVTRDGVGLNGVTVVTLEGPVYRSAVTYNNGSGDGYYDLTGLPPSTYRVSPSLSGALFSSNPPVTITNSPVIDHNFTFAPCTYSVPIAPLVPYPPAVSPNANFTVTSQPGCQWTAVSNVPWIVIANEGIGSGNDAVNFVVQHNYGGVRSGTISVNGQIHTLTQSAFLGISNEEGLEGGTCNVNNFTVDSIIKTREVVLFAGSTIPLRINTSAEANCGWTANSNKNWLRAVSNESIQSGSKNESVIVQKMEEGTEPRRGKITVLSKEFIVIQTPPQLEGCNFNLSNPITNQSNINYGKEGGSGNFAVTVSQTGQTPCYWTAKSQDSWVKLVGDPFIQDFGNNTKSFVVEPNQGISSRIGTIIVGNKAFTVTQDGIQNTAECSYRLSSPSQNYLAGGESASFNVTTGAGCGWNSILSSPIDAWIKITAGIGNGDGTVSFTLDPNQNSTERTGKISVGSANSRTEFTVKQAGTQQTCSYTISPGFQDVSLIGAAGNIQVKKANNASCSTAWQAQSNNEWIKITSPQNNSTGDGSINFIAQTNNTSVQRVGSISIAGQTFTITQEAGTTRVRTRFDFDGDGVADISVFRPSVGVWYLLNSQSGFAATHFGISTDKPTPADFDGDGKTDIAVFRSGFWYWLNSSGGTFNAVQFGQNGDLPVPGDFDGDGRADITVFRPSTGSWYRLNSSNGQFVAVQFGASEDKPIIGDFDGDGRADITVFRPSTGSWYRLNSSNGQFVGIAFGISTDLPVASDFDGDGKTDEAVYRGGNWYILNSTAGFLGVGFGIASDIPAPADYDGDGRADVAVYRNGIWHILKSTSGYNGIQFGASTDKPIPNAFVP